MAIAFQNKPEYAFGKIAETYIALWLRRRRGYSILPIYEKEIDDGKGPRFFTPNSELVAPDMLVMKGTDVRWIEAKHKDVFSWYWKGDYWVTGIDRHHYHQYCKIADHYPWHVWLLFLHENDRTLKRNEPWPCPTGLFGGTLPFLRRHTSHESDRHGTSGMVYWAHNTLTQLATLEEVKSAYHADPIL